MNNTPSHPCEKCGKEKCPKQPCERIPMVCPLMGQPNLCHGSCSPAVITNSATLTVEDVKAGYFDAPITPSQEIVEWEKEAQEIALKMRMMLIERHPLLAEVYDHPRLEKPVRLPETCPACHTTGASVLHDVQWMVEQMGKYAHLLTGTPLKNVEIVSKLNQIFNKGLADKRLLA